MSAGLSRRGGQKKGSLASSSATSHNELLWAMCAHVPIVEGVVSA